MTQILTPEVKEIMLPLHDRLNDHCDLILISEEMVCGGEMYLETSNI